MASKPIGTTMYKGREVVEYDNGLMLDAQTKHIARPANGTMIDSARAPHLHRARQEKTAALLRSRITAAHNSNMPDLVKSSAAAFAESGAMLYEQVVLNSEAYPRDRKEVWEMLGKYAQALPDSRTVQIDSDVQAVTAVLQAGTAQTLARLWQDVRQAQRDVIPMRIDIEDDTE